jgi:hypothetical protein
MNRPIRKRRRWRVFADAQIDAPDFNSSRKPAHASGRASKIAIIAGDRALKPRRADRPRGWLDRLLAAQPGEKSARRSVSYLRKS